MPLEGCLCTCLIVCATHRLLETRVILVWDVRHCLPHPSVGSTWLIKCRGTCLVIVEASHALMDSFILMVVHVLLAEEDTDLFQGCLVVNDGDEVKAKKHHQEVSMR